MAKPDPAMSAPQRAALEQWRGALSHSETGMPLRSALKPEKCGTFLPDSTLFRVTWSAGKPRFSTGIEGARVISAFGCTEGRALSDIYAPERLEKLLESLTLAATSGTPQRHYDGTALACGRAFSLSRLLLAYSDVDGLASRILAVHRIVDIPVTPGMTPLYSPGPRADVELSGSSRLRRTRFQRLPPLRSA